MTLLIRGVKILGADREFTEAADVFVDGDRISAIGLFPDKSADTIIDGEGMYMSPGFIDVNTSSDHYFSILNYPDQEDFLRQGVTTIIGGMCGSSLAPLASGNLDSLQKWGDISEANVSWSGVGELLAVLDKKRLGVNFATLIGHSTIRRAIIGEQIRDLTESELQIFSKTLESAMQEGGFGLSTGLEYVHSHKTPYSELKFLAAIVKKYGGVYATHLREMREKIGDAVDETITLADETGVKTLISHFVPFKGSEDSYKAALDKIEALPPAVDLDFDIYPTDASMLPLYTFLPGWMKTGGKEVMLSQLQDVSLWPRIMADIPKIALEDFTLAQAPGNVFLVGRSLKDLMEIYSADYKTTLLKVMAATKLRGIVLYKNLNYDLIRGLIANNRAFIASNAASYPYNGTMLKSERGVSSFTKFISLAVCGKIMPLAAAIDKITAKPARKFNLQGRGVVKEGNFADLTLFTVKDSIKNDVSSSEICINIEAVVVNGEIALQNNISKKALAGKVLRHVPQPS